MQAKYYQNVTLFFRDDFFMILLWVQPVIIAERNVAGFTPVIKSVPGQPSPASGQAMIYTQHLYVETYRA